MSYTTVAAVKTYLGISGTGDDALLGTLLTGAQGWLETRSGQKWEASKDTTQYCDALRDVYGLTLHLPTWYCQLTSITNGDGVAVASSAYVTEPRNGTPFYAVTLKASKGLAWVYTTDPENAITVVGRAAWSLKAPDHIAHATTRLVGYLYRQKDASTYD